MTSLPPKQTKARKRRLDRRGWIVVWTLILTATLAAIYSSSSLPGASTIVDALSLQELPHEMRSRVVHLLSAPPAALLVVLVRLTLGLRVLGPFRSVLLAIAFQVTGLAVGLVFFAGVVAVVFVLKPVYKGMKLPFFGRSAAMLASVAIMIIATMMIGIAMGVPNVERVAYFPVVVLTLSGDAFASAWRKEGARSAFWRAGVTAATAAIIAAASSLEATRDLLLSHVELQLWVLAAILLTCEFLNFKLLNSWNPRRPIKARTRRAARSS